MTSVVFLRGVNVGGTRVLQPSQLTKELAHLGVINVGAAGTFVVRSGGSHERLRAEFLRRLKFPAEMMICRGSDITRLVAEEPFPAVDREGDVRRFLSILSTPPRLRPELPLEVPTGESWQVRFIRISGRFALAWWRRLGSSFVDPNTVAERRLGVAATTRNWNTIVRIAAVLDRLKREG
jgi:uncharacterized protein (DUF1697 family)